MKMPRIALLAFTLTSVVAFASANAADMYRAPAAGGYKDTPYVTEDWAGFYAGVNGGGAWSEFSDKFALTPFGGIDPQGGFGGGQIGYNWQGIWHPHLVLGVEADIQGAGIEDKATFSVTPFKSSLDYFGTVRGRLGYAFGPSLLYATGGFAYGGIDNEIGVLVLTKNGIVAETAKNTGTATGYTVGGGIEYKFNSAWSVKAEYQFINLGRNDPEFRGVNLCTVSAGALKCEDDAFHTARVGLNYHFGTGYVPLK
jgi:outer membrane immunogenic protein